MMQAAIDKGGIGNLSPEEMLKSVLKFGKDTEREEML